VKAINDDIKEFTSSDDLYDLFWQRIVSDSCALEEHDIASAPQTFSGTVKMLYESVVAAFEWLFPLLPSERRIGAQENSVDALALVRQLDNPRALDLGLIAVQATMLLNIMLQSLAGATLNRRSTRCNQTHRVLWKNGSSAWLEYFECGSGPLLASRPARRSVDSV
jgi:hypothetical protein